jgi:hypothetical protein
VASTARDRRQARGLFLVGTAAGRIKAMGARDLEIRNAT